MYTRTAVELYHTADGVEEVCVHTSLLLAWVGDKKVRARCLVLFCLRCLFRLQTVNGWTDHVCIELQKLAMLCMV